MDVVLGELGDAIRFVFRHFPVMEAHAEAERAAEAAESVAARAGEEAFWTMHDILFENQDALSLDDLLWYAEAAGADRAVVADDLASRAMRARLGRDVASDVSSGVEATPTFFVNGVRFEGDGIDADAFTIARGEAARAKVRD